jgi:hypothetical protein
MKNFVAFDLEIARDFSEGRPYGISCAATITGDDDLALWHGGIAKPPHGEMYPPQMTPDDVGRLIDYLWGLFSSGYKVVTWNGLGFDFDVLAEESGDLLNRRWTCVDMAMNHIDPAFEMLCDKGFMIGLDTAAQGLGVEGKTEGMHGSLAPIMWQRSREDQDKVLEYVAQDARVTANVYRAILEKRMVPWISQAGRQNYWLLRENEPVIVSKALDRPKPDTSWMTNPRKREDLYGWTGYKIE